MKIEHPQKVVVVGGGYAGAMAAVRVAGRARRGAEVTLIDPRAELVQRLRLHQAAAGQKVRSYNLSKLTGRKVTNVRGEAYEIDTARSLVRVRGSDEHASIPFDFVILATGSTIDAESVPGVSEHAHSLASPESAARLNDALSELPEGSVAAVCGGGMTGIEAASEFERLSAAAGASTPAAGIRVVTWNLWWRFGRWRIEPRPYVRFCSKPSRTSVGCRRSGPTKA
ncbi:MAG: FAD-dependent oxidoreductase [Thermoleophilaceae bacterium]|nr:FAD-dependent oxidoreductase [Thermoleophilaceae bacterium]